MSTRRPRSKISHDSRAASLDGDDGLFPDDGPTTHVTAAVDVEVRSRGEETGAVSGAEEASVVRQGRKKMRKRRKEDRKKGQKGRRLNLSSFM